MAGILALLGGGKPSGDKMEMEKASSDGPERTYAREAFSALQDGDEEGFVEAFISAVEACSRKAKSGGYDDEEEDMESEY